MERRFDELCPYIREAGIQGRDSWKSFARKIYDHQFFFCFKGTANFTVADRYYKIQSGQLVIIPPNTPHRFWVDENEKGELYWFHCDLFFYPDREWVSEFYKGPKYVRLFSPEMPEPEHIRENPVFEGGYQLPVTLSLKNPSDMEYRFRAILKAYNQQNPYWHLTAHVHFMVIFTIILQETRRDDARTTGHSHVIHQIETAVAHNYYRKLSVAEICAETGLNTEYASKLFKQETGQRLVEYVNCYRIKKAKSLLLESDLSVADIAEMVGFSSENYFCSVTKKLEGKTPEALRDYLMTLMSQESPPAEHTSTSHN